MTTIYLALEGCHGTGTSTHADALAEALRAEHFAAQAYHHPRHPDGCAGAARVAWYAGARAQLAAHPIAPIVVMDRGPMSGVVYATSVCGRGRAERNDAALYDMMSWHCYRRLRSILLDAADDLLDARIAARGERPEAFHEERRGWRSLARSFDVSKIGDEELALRCIDTGRPVEVVRADLLAWAVDLITRRMGER